MKKLFLILAVVAMSIGTAVAQNADANAQAQPEAVEAVEAVETPAEVANPETAVDGESLHYVLLDKFIEGGWVYMLPILLVLVLGMAIAIERILYLSLSTVNTKKFIADVEKALNEGGIEAAKELCRNTRGPIASIYYQGLDRYHLGLDAVEKSIVSYGSVQTGKMESGLGWLSLFIALAPSLGFLGTVIGLVQAFDNIAKQGDISPTIVAGGMKVALLTTLFGLIAAMVLQVLYNFVIVKIDNMVNEMEDASITLTDILTAYEKK